MNDLNFGFEQSFSFIYLFLTLFQSSGVTESQTKLLTENGAAYSTDTPVVMKLGSSFYVTGNILENCEG